MGDEFQNRDYRMNSYVGAPTTVIKLSGTIGFGGYGVQKFMCPGTKDKEESANYPVLRLAEVYLIYAEACLSSQPDEAKKYINKIQQRAGSATVSATVDLEVLQNEKQYELWFEGCRWFDIVRWGIAKQCYDKVLDNVPYQTDEYWTSGGSKPHKLVYDIRHPYAEANITLKFVEGKNEYWPLPQNIIEINDQIHQVRGWAN